MEKSIKKNKNQGTLKAILLVNKAYTGSGLLRKSRLVNVCKKTGRSGAYNKYFGLSRHSLKALATAGLVQNLRSKSW